MLPTPLHLRIALAATLFCPASFLLSEESGAKPWAWRGQSVTEFDPADTERFGWSVVDDGVMGGLSRGQLELSEEGTMRFSGDLSLKNNGGFSTVRSEMVSFDLSNDLGLLLLVKGDGRSYQAWLATDERYRSMEVSFMAEFETTKGNWQQVKVPFADFKASFRGMDLPDRKLDPAKIQRIGILLGDKIEGPFNLELDWIRTYGKGPGSSAASASAPGESGTLVDRVLADGRFGSLAAALKAGDLVKVLQGSDPLTVFAPTDEAFAKLPDGVLEDLLRPENKQKLVSILTYHVAPGVAGLGDALKQRDIATVQGETVAVGFAAGRVRVNEATLLESDLECSNGVIHVIDSVLLPPAPKRKTVLSVAAEAGGFSTLLAAVRVAGLDTVLEGEGPFTVFAPTDEAFAALPEGTVESLLKTENRAKLVSVLSYHVVTGRVSAGEALNAGAADSLEGASLRFGIRDGLFKVEDATIRTADLEVGNGLIHVIDSVLLPPSMRSAAKAESAATRHSPSELIEAAIEKGVPLFNGGDAKGCAETYESCLEALAADERIDEATRSMLENVVEMSKRHRSDVDRAWFLRKALDEMMAYLSR